MACWPAASPAAFDPTDVVQIQASATMYHDNNLYRLPDIDSRLYQPLFGVDPANKSDTVRILGVGLKFDKLISRQRLIADLNLNKSTYDNNSDLDFDGGNGRLSWLWQAGNYWSGEATYRKSRTLGGFGDERRRVQDLIDTDTYSLIGGYQFHPRWRLAADYGEQDSTHSARIRQSLDVNAQIAGLTLTYRTPADNSIGLQARQTDRSYPNRVTAGSATLDDAHTETRLSAITAWRFSGALKLDAQLGHVDLQHDELPQRDFSGATWRAAATWEATGKLRFVLNGARDLRIYEDNATNYVVVDSIGISPTFAVTPKVILQGDFSFEKRDYRGNPGFLAIAVPNREDDVRLARVSVSYSPIRSVDLSLSVEAGDRKSNIFLNDYDYQSWFGTVRVNF